MSSQNIEVIARAIGVKSLLIHLTRKRVGRTSSKIAGSGGLQKNQKEYLEGPEDR